MIFGKRHYNPMKIIPAYHKFLLLFVSLLVGQWAWSQVDSTKQEPELKYPFTDQTGGLYLDNPVNVTATYDPSTGLYLIEQKVAGEDISEPVYMTEKEYSDFLLRKRMVDYYLKKSRDYDEVKREEKGIRIDKDRLIPGITVKSKMFQRIFGGDEISLTPNGYASFDLGVHFQKIDNPQVPKNNRSQFDIDVDQRIQLSLLGKVGENLQLKANYDTQAGFAFENKLNFRFSPKLGNINDLYGGQAGEDNIIQNIEVGNINFPLKSSFMRGPTDLFGAKIETKWGKTYVSAVFSEQRSQAKTVTAKNGGLLEEFNIKATDYEANANFYLGSYFYNNYDASLATYPLTTRVTITNLEVWVKNRTNTSLGTKRAVVAMRDIGNNGGGIPNNDAIYTAIKDNVNVRNYSKASSELISKGYVEGVDFVVEENMRLLSPSEYTFNPKLGTLFLNQAVNTDETIAVSYQLQEVGATSASSLKKVGELTSNISGNESDKNTKTIIAKLIKGRNNPTNKPLWDLMMKNVYSISSNPISQENFRLDIVYNDAQMGMINYLNPTGTTDNARILTIENLDRLSQSGQEQTGGDGMFDFVSDQTVSATAGKIIFPTVRPFDTTVSNYKSPGTGGSVSNPAIYDNQQEVNAGESSKNDKFFIKGQYTSSGSAGDIALGAINVPEGSVKVTANGQELIEGVDYTVDYTMGTVKILNQSLKDSGVPINVSLEDQGMFSLTKQRFVGVNVERRFSENFQLGATFMNFRERSITPKVNYGSEPVNNTMLGINGFYTKEAPFLTRWVDALPLIETKAPSHISVKGEVAYLLPGQAKNTNNYSYLDDFEDSKGNISIKDPFSWTLASAPSGYGGGIDDLKPNYKRGLLSWYNIDPLFYTSTGPLSKEQLSNNKSRRVRYNEIYPKQDYVEGSQSYISTFDLSYYPTERGPYNNNTASELPQDRWAGITRGLSVSNFSEANIEYVEFWMMDPYADKDNLTDSGELILHLGAVSEDVLKDGRKAYENGNPTDASNDPNILTATDPGYTPTTQALVYTFASTGSGRTSQDRGLDGLMSKDEASIYTASPTWANPVTGEADPAADDYVYYLDGRWSGKPGEDKLVERYKYFRNAEGNSPDNTDQYTSLYPDVEDANRDFTMDTSEEYFEYKLPIDGNLENNPYIVDKRTTTAQLENGQTTTTKWYQVRFPINKNQTRVGSPSLSSMRFARLIAKGFQQPVTFRFATFDLVRSNWRRYTQKLTNESEEEAGIPINDDDLANFKVGVISLEENSDRYVLPPGVDREEYYNTTSVQAQNEQSLLMQAELSTKNKVQSIYKSTNLDLRRYKHLEMFVHAEDYKGINIPANGDVELFIRMGTDVTSNYYEYSKPLLIGPKATAGMDTNTVWNPENKIDFNLQEFVQAKIERDQKNAAGDPNAAFTKRYTKTATDADDHLFVKGRPSLENVRYVVIGLRYIEGLVGDKNIEVWTNELRLSDIDNKGGFAGTMSVDAQLADFATVNASATYQQAGFVAINEGPTERSQEDVLQYVVNTTVNADKLLPEKWGVKLPISYSYGEQFIDPLYSPIDTDVKFKDAANRDELEKVARDYTSNSSLNLLNIRKVKTEGSSDKNHPWDIENFSASMSYNREYHRDFYVEKHDNRSLRLGLDYNYSFKQYYIQPLKNWRAVNDTAKTAPYLQWAKEMNINLKPSRLSFGIEIDRRTDEYLYRDVSQYSSNYFSSGSQSPIYSNNFYFNWRYQIGFDLTRSLKLDFMATRSNIVDNIGSSLASNVSVWDDLTNTGRPMQHTQKMRLSYQIPFELVPYLDFMQGDISYDATYDWRAVGNNYTSTLGKQQGNIIQNQHTLGITGGLNFETIWAKKSWYTKYQDDLNAYKQDVSEYATKYQEKADKKKKNKKGSRKVEAKGYKHHLSGRDYLYGLASSLKQVQLNFNVDRSTIIPGIMKDPGFFGVGSGGSPTLGFVLGSQADIRAQAIQEQWVSSAALTDPYQKRKGRSFNYTASLEPLSDLKIEITGQNEYQNDMQQYGFNIDPTAYESQRGNFSTTSWAFNSFTKSDVLFDKLRDNTLSVANRISGSNGSTFPTGYGIAHQGVLMEALLKTYGGTDREKPVSSIPLPNWSLSYSGLTNNRYLNKWFNRIDLTHAYRSTYSAVGIETEADYISNPNGNGMDANNNYLAPIRYDNITFVETFAPLIGVDMTMRNNLQVRFMYNRDRVQSFSFTNYSLTDQQTNEFQFGLGYVFKDMKLNLRYRGKKKTIKGDMTLRSDLIMRDTETSILRLIEDDAQITAGDKQFSLKTTLDYKLSQNFTLMFFYNHLITSYKVSTAYPVTDIRAGISAKFTFGQ